MNVLITGGLGKTAKPIVDLLSLTQHKITILDIEQENPYKDHQDICVIQGDICNQKLIKEATKSMDVILHLAVNTITPKNSQDSFNTNVYGTYNLLSAALQNHVKKVILASSAPVHLAESKNIKQGNDYICSSDEDFTYDLTKKLQEHLGENFAQTYNMNILVLRLGHIVDGRAKTDLQHNPLENTSYCKCGWVCQYDVAEAFAKALETDFRGYHLLNIIGSYQAQESFDLVSSKKLLGFECKEKFLEYE